MTVLPQPSPPADQWTFQDYDFPSAQSRAAAGGTCQAVFGPVDQDELWLLERLTVSCTSSAQTVCSLYADTVDPSRLLDFTATGNGDVADEASPIQLPTGTTLLVVWTNADAGAIGTARAQLQILRRPS